MPPLPYPRVRELREQLTTTESRAVVERLAGEIDQQVDTCPEDHLAWYLKGMAGAALRAVPMRPDNSVQEPGYRALIDGSASQRSPEAEG